MQFGICSLPLVPCRKETASASEMVTQLLFGEHYQVIDETETWMKVLTAYEKYECWITRQQHTKISEATFKLLDSQRAVLSTDILQVVKNKENNMIFHIPMGSSLPCYENKECKIENNSYVVEGGTRHSNIKRTTKELIETAFMFSNAPYLWGGKSILGIDCSGFTQLVFKLSGYKLPRDAYQQAELGSALSFVEEAQAGDLAFFDNEEGKIVHVGIVLDNQQIIHASGFVRIDKFDHYGIFHTENKKYSHMLRVIKRIL